MKCTVLFLSILFVFTFTSTAYNQCDQLIRSNFLRGQTQFITTVERDLVVRGDFTYRVQLVSDARGIMLKMVSVDGMLLQRGDELILIDQTGKRQSLVFTERGTVTNNNNIPVSENFVSLSIGDLEWLSEVRIPHFFLRKSHENVMRKISVHSSRGGEFQQMVRCVLEVIDLDHIAVFEPAQITHASAPSSRPPTSTPASRPAGTTPSDDSEIQELQTEFVQTRERLRREIEAEHKRADEIKEQIRQQVAIARKNKEEALREFERAIADERAKTTTEVMRLRAERAELIAAERATSVDIRDSLQKYLTAEMRRAEARILDMRFRAAEEVDRIRKDAQLAKEKILNNLEEEKRLFADQVSNVRSSAASRISEINRELEERILKARLAADAERDVGVEQVIVARENAAMEVRRAREEAANAIAKAELDAALAIESIARDVIASRKRAAEEKALVTENHQSELLHLRELQAREREEILREVEELRASKLAIGINNRAEVAALLEGHRSRMDSLANQQQTELSQLREGHSMKLAEARMLSETRLAESNSARDRMTKERQAELDQLNEQTEILFQQKLRERKQLESAFLDWKKEFASMRDSMKAESLASLEAERALVVERRAALQAKKLEIELEHKRLAEEFLSEEEEIRRNHLKRLESINARVAERLREVEQMESSQLASIMEEYQLEREIAINEGREYRVRLAENIRDARLESLEEISKIRQKNAIIIDSLESELQESRTRNNTELNKLKKDHHFKLQAERERFTEIQQKMLADSDIQLEQKRAEMERIRGNFLDESQRMVSELHNRRMEYSDSLNRMEIGFVEHSNALRLRQSHFMDSLQGVYNHQRLARMEMMASEREAFDAELAAFRDLRAQGLDSLRRKHASEIQSLVNEKRKVSEELLAEIQHAKKLADERVEQIQREEVMRVHEARKIADREIESVKQSTAESINQIKSELEELKVELERLKADRAKLSSGGEPPEGMD